MTKKNAAFSDALVAIRGTGKFHCSEPLPFVMPSLRLPDGEELAFPLPRSQAKTIIEQAEIAPFGLGEETVHDEAVRKCWQLDAASLGAGSAAWKKVIAKIVANVKEVLGVEGEVVAEPYKLLLYGERGFFLPHRDTEKLGAMLRALDGVKV